MSDTITRDALDDALWELQTADMQKGSAIENIRFAIEQTGERHFIMAGAGCSDAIDCLTAMADTINRALADLSGWNANAADTIERERRRDEGGEP